MTRHKRQIHILGILYIIIASLLLVICASALQYQKFDDGHQATNANTRTNETSHYVNTDLNHGEARRYTTGITYDKIHNTVDYHINLPMSKELKGHKAFANQPRNNIDFDRVALHDNIHSDIVHIHHYDHNKTVKAKIIINKHWKQSTER